MDTVVQLRCPIPRALSNCQSQFPKPKLKTDSSTFQNRNPGFDSSTRFCKPYKNDLSNYRPMSHLLFFAKHSERVVKIRLVDYLSTNNLLNSFLPA